MRFRNIRSGLLIVCTTVLLCACASGSSSIPQLDSKMLPKKDIALVLIAHPKPDFEANIDTAKTLKYLMSPGRLYQTIANYPLGAGALGFDVPTRMANKDWIPKVQEIELDKEMEKLYFNLFSQAMQDEGFSISTRKRLYPPVSLPPWISDKYEEGRVREVSQKKADDARYDWSKLNKDSQPSMVFTLELIFTGITRDHTYAGVVTSPPRGLTIVIGSVTDTASKKLLWQAPQAVEIPIAGEWDQHPDYPALKKACLQSLEKAIDQVYFSFFKRVP